MNPKAIVMRTAGTNCDTELVYALKLAGFDTDLIHVNSFISGKTSLDDYDFLGFSGGFSHGDYLGSGKIFANKLKYNLEKKVPQFIEKGGLVLGVCNGFQILVKSGILPGFNNDYSSEQSVTLSFNDSGNFQCEWIELKKEQSKSVFTHGIDMLRMPIAHGEGKFDPGSEEILNKLKKNNQIVFKYVNNPNGSVENIAGICDETGRVLGLMPHPERNVHIFSDPLKLLEKENIKEKNGAGLKIFTNALSYIKSERNK